MVCFYNCKDSDACIHIQNDEVPHGQNQTNLLKMHFTKKLIMHQVCIFIPVNLLAISLQTK